MFGFYHKCSNGIKSFIFLSFRNCLLRLVIILINLLRIRLRGYSTASAPRAPFTNFWDDVPFVFWWHRDPTVYVFLYFFFYIIFRFTNSIFLSFFGFVVVVVVFLVFFDVWNSFKIFSFLFELALCTSCSKQTCFISTICIKAFT